MTSEIYLDEAFELLPKNLEKIGSSVGKPIYSNQKMAEKVFKWVERSNSTKQMSQKIRDGIYSKRIMIGYTDKGFFRFLAKKAGSWVMKNLTGSTVGSTVGWYSRTDGNIVISLSHRIVRITGRSIISIPSIITHELTHMAAFENNRMFFNEFKRDLVKYYSTIIEDQFNINLSNQLNEVEKLVARLLFDFETRMGIDDKVALNIWAQFFESIGYTNDDEIRSNVLIMTSPFLKTMGGRLKREYQLSAENVRNSLYRGYDSLGMNVRRVTEAYQELFYPSEIICILNQFKPTPGLVNVVNRLNFK